MAELLQQPDASLYNLIHQAIGQRGGNRGAERRGAERRTFPVIQRIAISQGSGIPHESEFFPVQCQDLSRRGVSFLLPERPSFRFLVVALGKPNQPIYVSAEVVHVAEVLVCSDRLISPSPYLAGKTSHLPSAPPAPDAARPVQMVLVGCRFLERLQR